MRAAPRLKASARGLKLPSLIPLRREKPAVPVRLRRAEQEAFRNGNCRFHSCHTRPARLPAVASGPATWLAESAAAPLALAAHDVGHDFWRRGGRFHAIDRRG